MTDDEHYFCVEDTNVPNLNLNPYLPLLVPWRPLLAFCHPSIPLQSSWALLLCAQRTAWSPTLVCDLSSKSSAEASPSFCAGAIGRMLPFIQFVFWYMPGTKDKQSTCPSQSFHSNRHRSDLGPQLVGSGASGPKWALGKRLGPPPPLRGIQPRLLIALSRAGVPNLRNLMPDDLR